MFKTRRALAAAAGLAVAVTALSACGSSSGSSSASAPGQAADQATWALPPNAVPNWIWPFSSLANFSVVNAQNFQNLMFRPLYWFGDAKGGPNVNPQLSLAKLPTFSADGKTLTIKLKPYKWSNGESLTAQDVVFWINMEKAEKSNWADYIQGQFPDNITSVKTPNASTVVLTTDKKYSQQWMLYNQISQITPMPMAWDMTGANQKGHCATSVSGCTAVYKYLNGQSKDLATYATNPLWQVVDGPWKLSSFNSDGHVTFVPNPKYSGPVKPTLKKFIEAPYTTDSAEYNVLRSGQTLDVGYIPTTDIAQGKPAGSSPVTAGPNPLSSNYTLAPWFLYGVNYFPMNFTNPTVGPLFKQLYIRQALQSVVDQNGIIKSAAKGYGVPTTGPIPTYPSSDLVSSLEKNNPYPFSVTAAKKYLTDHGWKVVPNGTSTCVKPGTGSGECGAGISAGTKLAFTLQYASGTQTITTAMDSMKSNAAEAGIQITLSTAPFNTILGVAVPTNHKWQMENWGGGWVYAPDYYPTGESIFSTGAGSNSGAYSNPAIDKLIQATNTQTGAGVMHAYEDALAKDLPVIWQPNYTYSLTEIANSLKGATPQNAFGGITPENWHY